MLSERMMVGAISNDSVIVRLANYEEESEVKEESRSAQVDSNSCSNLYPVPHGRLCSLFLSFIT